MANGQTPVSPAELNGDGLPEILKDPASVPAARAFYSSNPAFTEGSEGAPDSLEDIEMAVVSDAADKSINGRKQDITHALRFIRLREGREETTQGYVIGYDLAAKGLRWIRKNVKDEVIHRSAVAAKNDISERLRNDGIQAVIKTETEPSESKFNHDNSIQHIEKHKKELQQQLEAASEYLEERGSSSELGTFSELCSSVRPVFSEEEKLRSIYGTRQFDKAIHELVVEFNEDPSKLVKFINTAMDIEAFTRNSDPSSTLLHYLKAFLSSIDKEFEATSYNGTDFRGEVTKWLSLYETIDPNRIPKGRADTIAKIDDTDSKEKATILAMEFGFATIVNTLEKKAYDYKNPEKSIEALYDLFSEGLDFEWPNKINFVICAVEKLFAKKPIIGQYIKSAPELKTDDSVKRKAMDLWFSIKQAGINTKNMGFRGSEENLDPISIKSINRNLPSHKKFFDKRIPPETREAYVDEVNKEVVAERKKFLKEMIKSLANIGKPETLIGRMLASGIEIKPTELSPEDS